MWKDLKMKSSTTTTLSKRYKSDNYSIMKQFHAPDYEKRSIVVIQKGRSNYWLIFHIDNSFFMFINSITP